MSATTVFNLPDLGEGLQEAEIVAWHVAVGDHVVADQPLLSVETEKAIVEVPSPQSGYIAAIHAAPGDLIAVNSPLVEFANTSPDQGTVVGALGRDAEILRAEPAPAAPAHPASGVQAAPATRKLAAALNVDLDSVVGTGPDGAILAADVRAAAPAWAAASKQLHPKSERLTGVRRTMLVNMTRAGHEAVAATITDEADIDAWPANSDVTIRLIRAIAVACRAAPALNAWFDADSQTRTLHDHVDLAIAAETDEGLFAPVIRDVGGRDDAALRDALDRLKRDVIARSLPRDAMKGATLTLSNFGMFGGRFAALVVTPPQVAILGAGRIAQRVIASDGQAVVHRVLPLSLSFDHRVVTGVEAVRFLTTVIESLQSTGTTD